MAGALDAVKNLASTALSLPGRLLKIPLKAPGFLGKTVIGATGAAVKINSNLLTILLKLPFILAKLIFNVIKAPIAVTSSVTGAIAKG